MVKQQSNKILKKKILIAIDWYLPGFLAGGPIRSIYNSANLLKDKYDLTIITSNRDLNSKIPYEGMKKFISYRKVNDVKVVYLSSYNFWDLIKIITSDFDLIYLNSMFSFKFTLMPLIIKKIISLSSKIVLAPRGMLHQEALNQRRRKKKLYLYLTKFLYKQNNISFQATNNHEKDQIKSSICFKPNIIVLPNPIMLPKKELNNTNTNFKTLKLLYISRICDHKNLLFLIKSLKQLSNEINNKIELNIYGFIEEEKYWEKCKNEIVSISKFVKITYLGIIQKIDKTEIFEKHHFFILMSKSENFGHVVYESLSSGRPVIISDKTPWNEIVKKQCGYVVNLNNNNDLNNVFKTVLSIDQKKYLRMCNNALDFSKNYFLKQHYIINFSNLFIQNK